MERDFTLRFTEEDYSTKEEVKRALGTSSVDQIWNKIIEYRGYFKKDLDLFNVEDKKFHLCLSSSLQLRVVQLEKKLTKWLVYYGRLNEEEKTQFIYKSLFRIGKTYAGINNLTITEELLSQCIQETREDVPQAFISLKNYLNTIQYFLNRNGSDYDLSILASFYGKILKKEINATDYESYFRMIDLNNPSDHMELGQHYNASPLEKLEVLLKDCMQFSKNSKVFSLLEATIIYFYLIYIKPFDYFNEECAILSWKYILSHDDLDVLPFLLNIEQFFLNSNDSYFTKKFISSELSLDLTYFIQYFLDCLEKELGDFEQFVQLDEARQISLEFSSKETEVKTPLINQPPFKNNPVVFEQKVSMPTLPVGLDQKDVDLIAENLLELYPSLKKMQAQFYAEHCTIGKYYTISQYKKETGVAYETARTSMDNLAQLGFYKKEAYKNKFVYTPVVR